ncbi:hypothetical protein O3P69_012658 [Scylla paramamosain]|uniref:Uncharacterized protein n=1 Tax=Scylla paramamosain TaxID=85552 RepID=A0AAW0SKA4_SCYPA
MMQFKNYRVERVLPSAFYIPDFIIVEEEQHLIHQVYAALKPKWKEPSHRHLQNWGGLPHLRCMVVEHILVVHESVHCWHVGCGCGCSSTWTASQSLVRSETSSQTICWSAST